MPLSEGDLTPEGDLDDEIPEIELEAEPEHIDHTQGPQEGDA